jgi:hypothetical protein
MPNNGYYFNSQVGMVIFIRYEFDAYVLEKLEQFTMLLDVKIGEALILLSGFKWVNELKLGDIISHCKHLFSTCYNNSSVELVIKAGFIADLFIQSSEMNLHQMCFFCNVKKCLLSWFEF